MNDIIVNAGATFNKTIAFHNLSMKAHVELQRFKKENPDANVSEFVKNVEAHLIAAGVKIQKDQYKKILDNLRKNQKK